MEHHGIFNEQRANIKFCFKLGKSERETHAMLVQAYGKKSAVSKKCVISWFKRFREGSETTMDMPRSGRPSKCKSPLVIERVQKLLAKDPSFSIRTMSKELGIGKETVRVIVRDLMGDVIAGKMDQPEQMTENLDIQENVYPECVYGDQNNFQDFK